MKKLNILFVTILAISLMNAGTAGSEPSGESTHVSWETLFGEGGADIPSLPDRYEPKETSGDSGLTRIVAVVFPPNTRDILFVGEPGDNKAARLSPQSLLDAFVVAYRALSRNQAPGVSIDPTTEQMRRGLVEDDLMNIKYIGDIQNKELGFVAFEADRLMKVLSLGKDNITKEPITCDVDGFQNELALLKKYPGDQKQSWHRFWIQPAKGKIARSRDGRTLVVQDVALEVETRYQVPTASGLMDAARPAEPSAKAFAQHMTSNYEEFAIDFPIFSKLHAFAQITYAARAVLAPTWKSENAAVLTDLVDSGWLLSEYQISQCKTPSKTPATISRETSQHTGSEQIVTRTLMLKGGVDLMPTTSKTDPGIYSKNADKLQKAVLNVYARPQQRPFIVNLDGQTYHVVLAKFKRKRRSWQTDLTIGAIKIVRDYPFEESEPGFSIGNWRLRVPAILEVSEEIVTLKSGQIIPSFVRLKDDNGDIATLDRIAELSWHGQPSVLGYVNSDGRKKLYRYSNKWLYIDGELKWQSVGGGPYMLVIPRGGRIIEFTPDSKHRVSVIRTPDSTIWFDYVGDLLSRVRDNQDNTVGLKFSKQGRLTGLRTNKGQTVSYRYNGKGRLTAVTNNRGNVIAYQYGDAIDELIGFRSEMISPVKGIEDTWQFLVETIAPRQEEDRAIIDLEKRGIMVVRIGYDPDSENLYIGNKLVNFHTFEQNRTVLLSRKGNLKKHRLQASAYLPTDKASQKSMVVFTGPADLRQQAASMLRQISPTTPVATVDSLSRAIKSLVKKAPGKAPVKASGKVLFVESDRFSPVASKKIMSYMTGPVSKNEVIVVGNNDSELVKHVAKQAKHGEFRNKSVVLLTCGNNSLPGMVNALFENGAKEVFYFPKPIQGKFAPWMLNQIQGRLKKGKLLDKVIKEIRQLRSTEAEREHILDRMQRQIGRRLQPKRLEQFA